MHSECGISSFWIQTLTQSHPCRQNKLQFLQLNSFPLAKQFRVDLLLLLLYIQYFRFVNNFWVLIVGVVLCYFPQRMYVRWCVCRLVLYLFLIFCVMMSESAFKMKSSSCTVWKGCVLVVQLSLPPLPPPKKKFFSGYSYRVKKKKEKVGRQVGSFFLFFDQCPLCHLLNCTFFVWE